MRSHKYKQQIRHIQRDIFFVVLSILVSIALVKTGVLVAFFTFTQGLNIFGSFLAGIFFTSTFTIAPASIALIEIGKTTSPVVVAFYGALGGIVGDMVMFFFLRGTVAHDVHEILKKSDYRRVLSFFHLGFMRILSPILGALIIASPLPDEIGLSLMGISKVKPLYIVPIAFVMNFIGIWALIRIASIL